MILLIEDDKNISDALTDFLSAQGFNIELASCKADALKAIQKSAYELLIVDVSLPDGSGFEICEKASEKGMPAILYPFSRRSPSWKATMIAGVMCTVAIEILQPIFGRAFDINDIIMNTMGVLLAATIFFGVKRITTAKKN